MTPLAVALVALVATEPAAALAHRRAMHGRAWRWHRCHHRPPAGTVEANDLFPLVFAAATVAAMGVGSVVEPLAVLLWAGAGITAYGGLYLVVHDLYLHQRLGTLPGARSRYVRWVARAHAVHHLGGREPFGFLLPVVPPAARALPPGVDAAAVLDRRPASVAAGTTETPADRVATPEGAP